MHSAHALVTGPPFDAQEALGSFPKLTSVGGALKNLPMSIATKLK